MCWAPAPKAGRLLTAADMWHQEVFQSELSSGQIDAWELLSEAAEDALAQCQSSDASTVKRASQWVPRQVSQQRKKCRHAESFLLRRLRRLQRQIKQLQRQPEATLRRKVQLGLEALQGTFHKLDGAHAWNAESFAAVVDELVCATEQQERANCLLEWKAAMACSVQKQAAWIKRKADQEIAVRAPASTQAGSQQNLLKAVRPTTKIQEAENEWLRIWTAPADAKEGPEKIHGFSMQWTDRRNVSSALTGVARHYNQ